MDGPGTYKLRAFVSHIGKNTGARALRVPRAQNGARSDLREVGHLQRLERRFVGEPASRARLHVSLRADMRLNYGI